jgi:glycosyltransferase involved in cell wall biosynthesis
VLTGAGYGVHARQIARWFLNRQENQERDIQVVFDPVPWGTTPWFVDPKACNGLIGQIIQNSNKNKDAIYDYSFQLQLPNEWDPFLAKANIGLTAAVETDRCNPVWIDCINRMSAVLVPSEHIKRTLENSGQIKVPLKVIPESWFEACRAGSETKENQELTSLLTEADFNFLVVSQFTGNNPENDRKNIAYTIKWFLEEFKDNPSVGLVVKTNFGRNTTADKAASVRTLAAIVAECQKLIQSKAKVYLLHGHMEDTEVVSLYTNPKIKALLNLTRGEGFSLPTLEAATCGLPVIVTDWSAQTEFLRQGKYIKVDYELKPIHQSRIDNSIFIKDARWAYPVEADAKRKMRKFFESPSVPAGWAKELKEKLLISHSPEAIEKQYNDFFNELIAKE